MAAYRLAGGVLELMGGGGNILQALQSIASSMSSFIKNSQFQFASQVFGFFDGGAAQTVSKDSDLLLAGGSEASSVSEQFGVTPVPGAGSIEGEFFIPGSSAFVLKGDGRDFDPAPNLTQSRVRFGIDWENGEGFFEVSPTCFAGGISCTSALPNGQGNTWNITSVGSMVHITGIVKPSTFHGYGSGIDFDMLFTANSNRITYDITRDAFPAFELTRTLGQVTSFLVKDYGVSQRFGGFGCLMGYLCGQRNHQGSVPLRTE
jgi:hypothetical protein